MTAATPLLRIVGATKSFPGVVALSDVSIDLRHGEVLALVGENGAGKSTLMKLLSGIYAPDAGEFFLDGERVTIANPKHARELGISIIHQEFNLVPDLTIAQNIFLGRERRRAGALLSERELNVRATELFAQLGLALDPRERVSTLTVAKQQMVEIAKALSCDARVLIMDEPTAALNDAEVETLFALIRRFTNANTGVIYISHRMDELALISDRITVLRDGRGIDTRGTSETTTHEIISLMVGRSLADSTGPHVQSARDEVVLAVRGLGTKQLLDGVSFDLKRGEILGMAGLLGAGRTEVARALVGADRLDAGIIVLRGTEVTLRNPAEAARHGIGYLSEDRKRFGLLLNHDVNFNIALGSLRQFLTPLGLMKDKDMMARSTGFVRSLRIKTPSATQLVRNLSGGNQQKVVIAKWLTADCDILIFDEPTRGIDVGAKEEIYDLLNALSAQGTSIIMISSELPEVLRMSHRVAVMCEGRLTAILPAAEANQESVMHYATSRPTVLGAADRIDHQEAERK